MNCWISYLSTSTNLALRGKGCAIGRALEGTAVDFGVASGPRPTRLQPEFDVGEIRIDVLEGKYTVPATIKITCINRCKTPIYYKDQLYDIFYSLSVLGDKNDLIITSWATATRYGATVYQVSRHGVKIVFKKISRGYVNYFFDDEGRITLTTSDGGPQDDLQLWYEQTWVWDGHRFRKGKRVRMH